MKKFVVIPLLFLCVVSWSDSNKIIREILKEPLPPEELSYKISDDTISIQGPTFNYVVNSKNGSIVDIKVLREDDEVIRLKDPVTLWFDEDSFVKVAKGETKIEKEGKDQIILRTIGNLLPEVGYSVRNIFYNDGVVVSEFTLKPGQDWSLAQGIRYELAVEGCFTHYLHKRRDTEGMDCYQGPIPAVSETFRMYTPTSCLEIFSDKSALAMFTDMGDYYRSPKELDSSALRVDTNDKGKALVSMHQHLIHVGKDGEPYMLRAGKTFNFRVGLAIAPNRLPRPRRHDLRMFIWVGDEKNPYPTDEEIRTVAQLGFTLFQMHRLGPPGEPRPPAEELERVIKTVHGTGMLFLWTANADLQYAHAEEVKKRLDAGKWAEWEGYNYGGRYTASMDPFCDLMATCLASPNGLADYRMKCNQKMLERYSVDGMYIDDNLGYANCKRWKEHNHPQQVYDCLIELHDVNWQRRQLFHEKCPYTFLVDHCSYAFVLPIIAPFDGHLFGEGYDFSSVEEYKSKFGSFENMYAHGFLYAGDDESQRCPTESAYAFDLLTGGGQYCYLDWRLWNEKFPYAKGVHPLEKVHIKTYNLMQYYFGMYETSPVEEWKTSEPLVYGAIYHNTIWDNYLAVVVNRNNETKTCSMLDVKKVLQNLISKNCPIVCYDILQQTTSVVLPDEVSNMFTNLSLESYQIRAFYLCVKPDHSVFHLWGGKPISEDWDVSTQTLTLKLDAPEGVEDTIVLYDSKGIVKNISVNDQTVEFYYDPDKKVAFAKVRFAHEPIIVKVKTITNSN